MNIKPVFAAAAFAMAGFATSASAQVQANLDDLILGFRATGGTGQNVNLEVDLGSISQFYNQGASAQKTVTRLAASDLAAAYGANWATRTDLSWGIIGSTGRLSGGPNGQPASTLWATVAEPAAGTAAAPWSNGSRNAQTIASAAIEALYVGSPGSLNGLTATAGSAGTGATANATLAGSYTAQDLLVAGTSFGYFNPSIDNLTNIPAGSYRVSDLYELRPGTGAATYLGSFGLSTQGVLVFAGSPTAFTGTIGNSTFTQQPQSQSITPGSTVVFTAAATGTPAPTYQWYFGATAITGATSSRLVLTNVQAANAGNYTVVATNSSGSNTSSAANLSVAATSNPGRLVNLSVISFSGTGSNVLTVGFTAGGAGTSGQDSVLVRGSGPALTAFGVSGVLADPFLTLYQGQVQSATNDNWGTPATNGSQVTSVGTIVQAFPFTAGSLDAALVTNVTSGLWSMTIGNNSGGTGKALGEVYDGNPAYTPTSLRLINLSCKAQISSSNTSFAAGFSLQGSSSRTVLIRVTGPTLGAAPFSLTGTLADPMLTLYNTTGGTSTVIASNSAWGGDAQITTASNAVGAFSLTSATSKDAVLLLTLTPGTYSAQATSVSGGTGIALIEVYEVP